MVRFYEMGHEEDEQRERGKCPACFRSNVTNCTLALLGRAANDHEPPGDMFNPTEIQSASSKEDMALLVTERRIFR